MAKTPHRPKCPVCGTRQGYDEAKQVERTLTVGRDSIRTFTACKNCDKTIVWSVQILAGGSGLAVWRLP